MSRVAMTTGAFDEPEAIELARPDATVLRGLRWRCPGGRRAVVVHGLGEHAARQRNVCQFLARRGFDVVAFDHRGHGRSDGRRGALRHAGDLVVDLSAIVDSTSSASILLVGHSMGGLVALHHALAHPETVAGLVLSSPALDPDLNFGQKLLLAVMSRLAPGVAVANGLDPSKISHDAAIVRAYREDPLVHDRITARLARFIVEGSRDALERAGELAVPTLLLVAGDDRLVAPAGSHRFAQRAPRGRVDERVYDGLWHELFNESEPSRSRVFADLGAWLDVQSLRPGVAQ
ncbi:MAG TPA: alpha/beta hydrolase [Zeimonas sp.]